MRSILGEGWRGGPGVQSNHDATKNLRVRVYYKSLIACHVTCLSPQPSHSRVCRRDPECRTAKRRLHFHDAAAAAAAAAAVQERLYTRSALHTTGHSPSHMSSKDAAPPRKATVMPRDWSLRPLERTQPCGKASPIEKPQCAMARRPQRRPNAANFGPCEISAIGRCRHCGWIRRETAHTFSGDFCA